MRSLVSAALICAATLGSITFAEAMPTALNPAESVATIAGAHVEKAVVIVRKRVIVRRPSRVIVRRPRIIIR